MNSEKSIPYIFAGFVRSRRGPLRALASTTGRLRSALNRGPGVATPGGVWGRAPLLVALLHFIILGLLVVAPVSAADKPNVIVVFTDDHGYADLSCQGILDDVRTPHIDSLAAGGVRMTNGYVTAPQCTPSRAGLMAGRYQNRFNLEKNKQPLDGFIAQDTIAERLKKAGYATGMIGKWHLGSPTGITSHGFDDVYYKNSAAAGWANYDLEGNDVEGGPTKTDEYHIDACSAAARAFIKRHHDEPFFLYVAYRAPHTPLDATQKYIDRFPGEMPERRRKALAMLSAVDDGVGGILETLRKYKIEENTLIFFIGDNGAPLKKHKLDAPGIGAGWDGSLNDPLNGEKGTVIEGGCRVPFVVSWKGRIPGGQVYDHPVISLDVAATAVELAGLPDDPKLDGVNLVPYLTGKEKGAPHDALYWRWTGQSAIREGKWKYIQGGDRRYLFDLDADIGEATNIIDKHPEIANRMMAKLAKWSEGLNPPGIAHPLGGPGASYFDFYLDGIKESPPPVRAAPKAKASGAKQPAAGARPSGAAFLEKRDRNKDGFLTLKEFIGNPEGRNVPALNKQFKARDKNEDEKLSEKELNTGRR